MPLDLDLRLTVSIATRHLFIKMSKKPQKKSVKKRIKFLKLYIKLRRKVHIQFIESKSSILAQGM